MCLDTVELLAEEAVDEVVQFLRELESKSRTSRGGDHTLAKSPHKILDLRRTAYLSGHPRVESCPPDRGVEVAFAGRSNVGKSSLINALCERRSLARTSAAPGRTRLLHFFAVDDACRLVDLPGYGFARASKAERASWQRMVEGYLRNRNSLVRLMLLMDVRHPLRDSDGQLLEWCHSTELPVHILLNKADKLSRSKAQRTLADLRQTLQGESETPISLASARTGLGLEAVRDALRAYLEQG